MFLGLEEMGRLPDERQYFASKQIEAQIRVPAVPSPLRQGSLPGSETSYSEFHSYSVSPGMTYLLFKVYEAISRGGYGEYSILLERRNHDIYMKVKGGRTYCYRVRLNELQEVRQVFAHSWLYILYKNSQVFEKL